MKDGNVLPLGERRRKARGLQILRVRREAEQIIDDHVDRAAHRIRFELGEVQRLRPDALARKRGVAVEHYGEHFCAATLAGASLLGARASDGDGIHGFKVTGIGSEMRAEPLAFVRGVMARRADVILHVAAAQHAAWVHILKAGKNIRLALSRDVRHHVQSPAMAHAEDDLFCSSLSGRQARQRCRRENAIEQRNDCRLAFE